MESAKAGRLRYVTDNMPGIRRRKSGKGFVYIAADGKIVRDADELQRCWGMGISKRPEETPGEESNIAIIRVGAKSGTKPNTNGC